MISGLAVPFPGGFRIELSAEHHRHFENTGTALSFPGRSGAET